MVTKQSPTQNQPRLIRVFISSTFRDMQAERDELVKFIFPQLRKLCEQREVTWGEVDLRWGITDEQSAEGKVLPICLEEIRRCKPYFIGLLGERYGWIPDEIPAEMIEREPWLAEHYDQSVTELEILHGVLNCPEMAGHALFYFRDPGYINTLDPIQLKEFIEVPWREEIERYGLVEAQKRVEERNEKLMILKKRIRDSGLPLKENYRDFRQLGEWLLQDLTLIINRLFPDGSQPDPLQRETMEHEAFAASRAKIYIGGEHYFNHLNMHASRGGQPLLVLGEPGSGKSALLANWAIQYRAEHPEELVFMHFIGASAGSVDWAVMLRRIMAKLQRHFDFQGEIPDAPEKLRSEFPNWLHMASTKGKAVLILDALNQLEDRQGAQELTWLPIQIPENIRLIVSMLPGKSLQAARERNLPTLIIQQLTPQEREQLVHDYLAQYSKQLSSERVKRIVTGPLSANPLGLRILLEELRQFGVHERLDDFIDRYLNAATISEMYDLILQRCEVDFEEQRPGLVKDALSYIWAGRRGLSEAELLDLLGSAGQPLPQYIWSPLYLALEQSFLDRGGLLDFFHDYFRQAVKQRYLASGHAQERVHIILADYFASLKGNPPRKIDEFPWQLVQAGQWQCLYEFLADLKLFQVLWEYNRYDLSSYWAAVESKTDRNRVNAYHHVVEDPTKFDLHVINWLALFFKDAGFLEQALALHKEQERICNQSGDQDGLQKSLGNQANILYTWGSLEEAMALHKKAETISRRSGNLDGLQASFNNQALIVKSWGNFDEALKLYREAESICRQMGNINGLQTSLGNQALIYVKQGKLEMAMALLKEQERFCRNLGNLDGLQRSLGSQANILHGWGKLEEALVLNKEGERIYRQLGNLVGLQSSLNAQANILADMGKLGEAMALYQELEKMCRNAGSLNNLQVCLGNQAIILQGWGKLDEAMSLHQEEERICRQLGNQEDLAASLGNQAVILKRRGKLEKAVILYKESERIYRQLGNLDGLQASLNNQANMLADMGKLVEAMELHKEQERICRKLNYLAGLQGSLSNQAVILEQWGKLEDAMVLYKDSERICRQLGDLAGLQTVLINQANVLRIHGKMDGAMALYKDSELISRELGNLEGLSISLGNQALILLESGKFEQALVLFIEKERISRQLGDNYGLCKSLAYQVLVSSKLGGEPTRPGLIKEALALSQQLGDNRLTSQIASILHNVMKDQ